MVEEEDQILRSDLGGVTAANHEDIERNLLTEVLFTAANHEDIERNLLTEVTDHGSFSNGVFESAETSATIRSTLQNRLKSLQTELDVVSSIVDEIKDSGSNEKGVLYPTSNDTREEKSKKSENGTEQTFSPALSLQHALVFDRLRCLEEAKTGIENELCSLGDEKSSRDVRNASVARYLVKGAVKAKNKKTEQGKKSVRKLVKQNAVSLADDADFDSVLDSASSSFVETEKDKLVRKGILTPFHRLKGFEKRVQSQDYSNNEEEHQDTGYASISRTVQSMSEAKNSRATTKLLDAKSAPSLRASVQPFHRLKDSVLPSQFPDGDKSQKKTQRKERRPLPDRKWRNLSRREDNLDQEGGGRSVTPTDEEPEHSENINELADQEISSVTLDGGLKIPESIFRRLFDYQKVGVQWLWELHCQRAGGIIGDEMGLGKTIQVLSFLGALHFSRMYAPSIIICPVTLLRQWKREAQKWYPKFTVGILHDSARESLLGKKRTRSHVTDSDDDGSDVEQNLPCKNAGKWDPLIRRVMRSDSGLLITTYEQLRIFSEKLLDIEWGYAVLDEGHRIRNPDADVTILCKQLQTVHRIIMTGAPIQNKLSELWSLFDFVFPGKLGVLPIFEAEFSVPITVGGYVNASPLQVSTAYRCAVVLRDLIMPYLLRRMKADLNAHLTKKTEHVLFCSLTADQLSVYRAFLASSEVEEILNGSRNSLYGIDVMRKICNHPDLLDRERAIDNPTYGSTERSGKMKVVQQVLRTWKDLGHRVLLFTQTQQMLDIIESFLRSQCYSYRRMDGLTPVKQRMTLIDEFNNSDDVFVFILTTKVGGLGTNLTGANRVIIFDPDWNPSTDTQARERAWRIGQTRDVVVYRLITGGTIEEKVYHRQIYKHFLTNKILKNPQQRRFFKSRDLRELFTLNDDAINGPTETSNIFNPLFEEGAGSCPQIGDDGGGDGGDNGKVLASPFSGMQKAEDDKRDDGETSILKSLFCAHGIHSTMDHDLIMNAHEEKEKVKLEEEATQVAQRAAEALRQSRLLRSRHGISVPTWTGRFGAAGGPPSSLRRKFGSTVIPSPLPDDGPTGLPRAGALSGKALSSAHLLAKLKGVRESAVADGRRQERDPPVSSKRVQPEVLLRQLCTFLELRGGRASSSTIVDSFKDRVPSAQLPLFKKLLKEIAVLKKETTGSSSSSSSTSLWELKPEYLQHQQEQD